MHTHTNARARVHARTHTHTLTQTKSSITVPVSQAWNQYSPSDSMHTCDWGQKRRGGGGRQGWTCWRERHSTAGEGEMSTSVGLGGRGLGNRGKKESWQGKCPAIRDKQEKAVTHNNPQSECGSGRWRTGMRSGKGRRETENKGKEIKQYICVRGRETWGEAVGGWGARYI